jgi:hypothetical protein
MWSIVIDGGESRFDTRLLEGGRWIAGVDGSEISDAEPN